MTSVSRPRLTPRLFYTDASRDAAAVLPEHRSQARIVRRLPGRATRGGLLNHRRDRAGRASRRTSTFRRRRRGSRRSGVVGKEAYPGEALARPRRCARGRDGGQAGLRLRPRGIASWAFQPLDPGVISNGGVRRFPARSCARQMTGGRYRRALLHGAAGDLPLRALPDLAPCSNGVRPRGVAHGSRGRAPCSTPARPRGLRADLGRRARDGLPGCCDRVFQNRGRPCRSDPAPASFREQVQPAEPPIHPSAGTRRRFNRVSSAGLTGLSGALGFRRR